jgi:hypothetical protein
MNNLSSPTTTIKLSGAELGRTDSLPRRRYGTRTFSGKVELQAWPDSFDLTILEYMNDRTCKIAELYFCRALLLTTVLLATGCGQLYRVSPLPEQAAGPSTDLPASSLPEGLHIEARGLDGDRSLEHFEGNLPLAGVLAVEVRLINRSDSPLSLSRLKFALFDGSGKPCSELRPERALSRVMKFYGNRIYQIEAHRETVESYRRITLTRAGELRAGEEQRGIIFYAIPPQGRLDSGFSLRVVRGGASASLLITTPTREEK